MAVPIGCWNAYVPPLTFLSKIAGENRMVCEHMTGGHIITMKTVLSYLHEKTGWNITIKTPSGFIYPVISDKILMIDMKHSTVNYGKTFLEIQDGTIRRLDREAVLSLADETGGYVPGEHCKFCENKNCPFRRYDMRTVFIPSGEPVDLDPVFNRFNELTKKAFRKNALLGMICPLYATVHAIRGGLGREAFYAVYTAFANNMLDRVPRMETIEIKSRHVTFEIPVFNVMEKPVAVLPRDMGEPHAVYTGMLKEVEVLAGREIYLLKAPYFHPPVMYHYRFIEGGAGKYIPRLARGTPYVSDFCRECDVQCSAYRRAMVSALKLREPALRVETTVRVRPATQQEIKTTKFPGYEGLFVESVFREMVKMYPETPPEEITLNAFIDTGSPETIINNFVFQRYNIPPVAVGEIQGVGGVPVSVKYYVMHVTALERSAVLLVAGTDRVFDGKYMALLGMDFVEKSGARITIAP